MVASDFRFMMVEITHVATPHYREANIYGWMPTDAWAFFVDLDEGSEGKR
jgi:hypothetical protein